MTFTTWARPSKRQSLSAQAGRPQPALKFAVAEILLQQSELPQMIGDVLGGIGQNSVRAHQHLILLMLLLHVRCSVFSGLLQNPAACQLAFGLLHEDLRLRQQLERGGPKALLQNAALPHQQIVVNAEPPHLLHMLFHNLPGDEVANPGSITMAFLQRMKNPGPFLHHLRLLCVRFVNLGIDVPAVVSESYMLSRQRNIQQTGNGICQLIAEIIHIVVYLNRMAGRPQYSHQRIPDTGVS